jgi:hypothetical protein
LITSELVHVVVPPTVEHDVEHVPALPVDAMSANKAPIHNNPNPLVRMLFYLHGAKTRPVPVRLPVSRNSISDPGSPGFGIAPGCLFGRNSLTVAARS